ncbi:MAG: hypothetical protein RLN75_06830, partial [Longimicrobiales bacterium]
GPVHVTRDGGANWADVTPPSLPADARINIIDPSPHDPGTAYVAAFRILMGDDAPYVYKTDDFGASWTLLTPGDNGIDAETPVRVIREDPDRQGLLNDGTEFGIYVSLDDVGSWMPFQQNMPATPITDLKVVDGDLYVSTMGRSFWIMDNLTPLHQMKDGLDTSTAQLLQPRDAYRIRGGGGFYGFGDEAAVRPQNRADGIMIDYWVPEGLQAGLTLEIVDATGNVVQTYEGGGGTVRTEQGQEMRAPFQRRTGRPGLSTEPGLHRIVWDMSVATESGRGPMALPGEYEVRLHAGDRTQSHAVELMMDPRVAADGVTMADLREQYDLIMTVSETMARAQSVAQRIGAGVERASGAALDDFEALQARMEDDDVGSYPKPMLLNQLRYLSGMIGRADQKPGRDAYVRLEQLETELAEIEAELERLERLIA